MRLIAAICTNRAPADVRPALEAAARQAAAVDGAEALLVTSGLTTAEHDAHAEAAAIFGARAVAAGPGLSVARNRALEETGDDDVLAYIDDDTIPEPDWLANLAERWGEAGPEVACIAGAIVPRWEGERPAWWSEELDSAFSLLDLGEGIVELDPAADREGWGANISFRAGPLREAGGFDPFRGVWGGVPLFGEESAVQRRLAERGHRLLYAGDVRVAHRIGPERLRLRRLWRRELYRGVSAGLDGKTKPLQGAGRAAKAAAGSLFALGRGDRPLAGERFARTARSAGGAISPIMRRRLRRRGWSG